MSAQGVMVIAVGQLGAGRIEQAGRGEQVLAVEVDCLITAIPRRSEWIGERASREPSGPTL
jgi:hypothetical protein